MTARVLQALDTHITASDQALLGSSTNAIVLEWAWTADERSRDPFAKEFRVYFRPVPPDHIQASLTGAATPVGTELQMTAVLNQAIAADAMKGRYVRSGETAFKVTANTAGQSVTLRFETSAIDPAALPVPGEFELTFPPEASELRPEQWPERLAVVPITAAENYQFVFRDRVSSERRGAGCTRLGRGQRGGRSGLYPGRSRERGAQRRTAPATRAASSPWPRTRVTSSGRCSPCHRRCPRSPSR